MRKLNYELKQLCLANREGSYGTQRERERTLTLIANQLDALGFQKMGVRSLIPKHVERLVEMWKNGQEELGLKPVSIGTLKNRLADLRWWARKAHKPGVVAKDNETYGNADRKLVSQVSKAVLLNGEALQRITDSYLRASLLLQREFGLRREEAIKFSPSYADRGDRIVLKATWTKGGKERELPVRTGLRERNVTRLEWSQVDLQRRLCWIHPDQAKTKKAIAVPLNGDAMAILRQQEGKNGRYVFTYLGKPVTRANNHAWRKALGRSGIEDFRWHDLRHTWASWHVQAGTPPHALQELGGWFQL